jgi:hypothetical protein
MNPKFTEIIIVSLQDLAASGVRRFPIPSSAHAVWLFEADQALKTHSAYAKAKAGDWQSALTLISDIALAGVHAHRGKFDSDCIFVAPFAREASGDNAIPQVFAEVCGMVFGASADQTIVQTTKVYHTGADAMERLALRPEFDGEVQHGKRYILVDDVTSLGGTLAELANYIQSKGGVVQGVFVLVNAGRSKSFSPDKRTLKILEARYGHELIEIFGIAVNALTANEARYLVGFRTADDIRNRLAKAKQEIDLRLRSKGIPSVFGG